MKAERALAQVLGGDVRAMDEIEGLTSVQLSDASKNVELLVRPEAVARVIAQYDSGRASAEDAQRWASFIRWGHPATREKGPITPLDIEYEAEYEDAIVEAIARLDELGDLIDGELREGEAAELTCALQRS
jgi:hypothetical protein